MVGNLSLLASPYVAAVSGDSQGVAGQIPLRVVGRMDPGPGQGLGGIAVKGYAGNVARSRRLAQRRLVCAAPAPRQIGRAHV